MARGPNPLGVAWSIARALRTRKPAPRGAGRLHHGRLEPILREVARGGVDALAGLRTDLALYRKELEAVDPDTLHRDDALAFWLNCYNAGALDLAAEAHERNRDTVLRVPGGFSRPWAEVAGERLSLDQMEHGKIRRFGDPRIHGALVCGSVSCPTLRFEPYEGAGIDDQLEDQMRTFLASGGAVADRAAGKLHLSRVFRWYSGDVVRPRRMPTFVPASARATARVLRRWLPPDVVEWMDATSPAIAFQSYDWSLACTVR